MLGWFSEVHERYIEEGYLGCGLSALGGDRGGKSPPPAGRVVDPHRQEGC
jgi:hypothetical protein